MIRKLGLNLGAVLLAVQVLAVSSKASSVMDDLDDNQKTALTNGEQVVITRDVADSAWPEVNVYMKSSHKAIEVISVFADYAIHKDMFADMPKSDPRPVDKFSSEVDYTMTFQPVLGITLKPENYTVLDTLSKPGYGIESYMVTWSKVKADSIKDIQGNLIVEETAEGSVLRYKSLISPPRPALARLLTGIAIQKVKDTAVALIGRVASEKTNTPDVLENQIQSTASVFAQIQTISRPVSRR